MDEPENINFGWNAKAWRLGESDDSSGRVHIREFTKSIKERKDDRWRYSNAGDDDGEEAGGKMTIIDVNRGEGCSEVVAASALGDDRPASKLASSATHDSSESISCESVAPGVAPDAKGTIRHSLGCVSKGRAAKGQSFRGSRKFDSQEAVDFSGGDRWA